MTVEDIHVGKKTKMYSAVDHYARKGTTSYAKIFPPPCKVRYLHSAVQRRRLVAGRSLDPAAEGLVIQRDRVSQDAMGLKLSVVIPRHVLP